VGIAAHGGFSVTSNTAQSVYGFSAPLLDGQTTSLSAFHGHVLLIVNTASQCGYTPQYAALESRF
jgi:glutathione peroxidase